MRVSKTSYIWVLIFVVVQGSAWSDDIEAPLPFNIEHTASLACINRLNQYHTILSAFFNGVPAASTMKRNDIVVPFIQTDSVFSPLSSGKKVVKYQAVGSYIRTPDRKYYSRVETDTNSIKVRLDWRTSDLSIYLNSSYENLCSDFLNNDYAQFSIHGSDTAKSFSFSMYPITGYALMGVPIIKLSDFCQNKTDSLASRIQNLTITGAFNGTTPSGVPAPTVTNQDKEDFRAKVLAQIKPGATVSTLCDAWGY